MILSTDLASHFTEIATFKTKMSGRDFPAAAEDKQVLLQVLLRAADMSNATRQLPTCLRWATRAMEEFLRQGDAEKRHKIPVTRFFDRSSPQTAGCQAGYIEVIA